MSFTMKNVRSYQDHTDSAEFADNQTIFKSYILDNQVVSFVTFLATVWILFSFLGLSSILKSSMSLDTIAASNGSIAVAG